VDTSRFFFLEFFEIQIYDSNFFLISRITGARSQISPLGEKMLRGLKRGDENDIPRPLVFLEQPHILLIKN
jgi:hypothetical protein